MTQISLKLFYKMPFARDDIGGLSEGGGVPGDGGTQPGSTWSSKVYVRAYLG